MVYLNIVCAVIASLLGFVFLCSLRRQKKARAHQNGNCLKSCENGTCDDAKMVESADIIVVGAGVVGSALAYTLGKVTFSHSLRILCLFLYLCDI